MLPARWISATRTLLHVVLSTITRTKPYGVQPLIKKGNIRHMLLASNPFLGQLLSVSYGRASDTSIQINAL